MREKNMEFSQVQPEQPLEAVIFDMDGLIFNTELLYPSVSEQILARRGHQLTQCLTDQMMGKRHDIAFTIMIDFHNLDATVEQLTAESDEIFEKILETELRLMPGFLELLSELERLELPKAIATSARKANAEKMLSRFDLLPRFVSILGGDEVEHAKPHPEIYLKSAERLGIDPAKIMVLEDSQTGCEAAISAEAYAVAVPGDHSKNHQFQGAAFVANTLADPRIYQALNI